MNKYSEGFWRWLSEKLIQPIALRGFRKSFSSRTSHPTRHGFRHRSNFSVPANVELLESRQLLSGAGLIINPTFDSTITKDPNAAKIEAAINQVIAEYESVFSDPVTINITYAEETSGISSSTWGYDYVPYSEILSDLKTNATTANAQTAIAHLPNTSTDPVLGEGYVIATNADMKALEPANYDSGTQGTDGEVFLDTSRMNLTRTSIDPTKYDLLSCVAHETDEVLGLGSALDPQKSFPFVQVEDLFRYDQNGNRSFTSSSSALSYFSLNGTTDIAQFNQNSIGDYGDWVTGPTRFVQDAFGSPGTIINPGVEFIALNAIGYKYVGPSSFGPLGVARSLTTLENHTHVFATTDFGFSDLDDFPQNAFSAVEITTLPTAGSLTDNGIAVTAGQFVSVADLTAGHLIFTPATNANGTGYASFTFQVQDTGSTANGGLNVDPYPKTMTMNITAVTQAPVGASNTVTTLENTAYTFAAADFGFTDPNNSPPNTFVDVKVKTIPSVGSLTDNGVAVTAGQLIAIADITGGKLVFTPVTSKSGSTYASFTFQVESSGTTASGGVNLDPTARTMTISVTPTGQSATQPPVGTSNTVTMLENATYAFTAANFGFTDPNNSPANTLAAVEVTTLPTAGSLKDNGVAVTAGQLVAAADITGGKLVFTPTTYTNGTAYSHFTFQVQSSGSTANGGVNLDPTPKTMTINVTAVSQAPSGTSSTITTLENTAYSLTTANFGFTDPHDSPANSLTAVKITTLPGVGSLTDNGVAVTAGQSIAVADITGGKLFFTPTNYTNGAAYTSLTFQVQDSGSTANGGVNLDPSAKTLTVNVTAVSQAPTGASNTKTMLENSSYTFATADFGFADPNDTPANSLTAVEITTLPSAGSFTDNGVAVTAGQLIAVADITGGKLTFTPATYANGSAYSSFTFQVKDSGSTANGGVVLDPTPDTMTLNVTAVSQAPTGASSTVTTLENSAFTFTTANFGFSDPHDSPANTLTAVEIKTLPTVGSLKDNGVAVTAGQLVSAADISSGKLIFTPATYANGSAYTTFTFQVQDSGSTANGGVILDPSAKTMTVNVTAVSQAPAGTSTTVTTLENTGYNFSAANFGFTDPHDSPANSLTAVEVKTLPAAGSLTDNGVAVTAGQLVSVADINAGKLIFTPATYANGNAYASFTFQVQDSGSTTNGGVNLDPSAKTMTVNVTAVSQAPTGTSSTVTTPENTGYKFSQSDFGFSDPNDNPASLLSAVEITTLPRAGALTILGLPVVAGELVLAADLLLGVLEFMPANQAQGNAYSNFTFQVEDAGSLLNGGVILDPSPKTMTVNVGSVSQAPTGASNTVTTLENSAYTFSTSDFGFSDPNDSPANSLTAVEVTTLPGAGSLKDNGVAVTAGQLIPVADITGGKLSFTPATYGNGNSYASFTFQVQDSGSTSNGGVILDPNPKTMTVNVTQVSQAPSGTSTTVTNLENHTYTFTTANFGFTDPHNSPANSFTAVEIKTLPTVGWVRDNGVNVTAGQFVSAADITAGNLTYIQPTFANGANYASFTFQVQDSGSTANGGVNLDPSPDTMTINVTAISQVPSGTSATVTTLENTGYTFTAADFGFTDPHDTPAYSLTSVKITTLPSAGSLKDNGVAVTAGQFVSVADINGGKLVFTPATYAKANAYASFTFQVQDSGSTANGGVILDPSPKTMTVNVTGVSQAPTGTSNTVTTAANAPYAFSASDFGFSDPHDSPANSLMAVKITTLPGAGSLTDNGVAVTAAQFVSISDINGGLLVFTPAANASGSPYASFTFQVQDNGSTANAGVILDPSPNTMTINVTSSGSQAPIGTSNTVTTLENSPYSFAASDFGFSDPNNSPANSLTAVEITTLPGAGSLMDNGVTVTAGQLVSVADINSGNLVFTPATYANGNAYASFTFQVQDSGSTVNGGVILDPSPKTMTINVTSVSQTPSGASNTVSALENSSYPFATSDFGFADLNDSPANNLTAVQITTLPGAGLLTDNGVAVTAGQLVSVGDINSGNLVFTPATYASGNAYASFTFQVQDSGSMANGGVILDPSPKTMTVNVGSFSQAPTGASNNVTTLENSAYTFATSDFGFSDPNNSPANSLTAVEITTLPGAGSLKDNGVAVTAGQLIPVADITGGKLSFTPATYANGNTYASFTFQVQDSGSTSNGGVILDPNPKTMTVNVTQVSQAPSGTSTTVTNLENHTYTFTTANFGFTDPHNSPANSLTAVEITSLPAVGWVRDNGVNVTAGQFVSVADIIAGNLTYIQPTFANGANYASFTFQVQDSGSTANGGVNLDPSPDTMTINVTAISQVPSGTSATVTTLENTGYTFTAANFGFTDPNDTPAYSLTSVKMTTLPSAGSLKDNGVAVTAGQFVSVADINGGKLVFTPATYANGNAYASFTFQVQDSGSTANGGVILDPSPKTMTINVTAVSQAPTGTSNTVSTVINTSYTFAASDFGFSDPHDSPVNSMNAVQITTLPKVGSLNYSGMAVTTGQLISVAAINGGLFLFTPAANASGSPYASFTFQVHDNGSTTNGGVILDPSPKTMTINVLNSLPPMLPAGNSVETYVQNGSPLTVAPNLVVNDAENISSATVSFTNWQSGDRVTFSNTLALQHTFVEDLVGNTSVLTITGTASAAGYQTLLRSVQFWSVAGNPVTAVQRIATITITDLGLNMISATQTLAVAAAPPSVPLSLSGLSGVTYIQNATPLTIAPNIVISDSQNISSATVSFTNWQAGDRLTFSNTLALQHTFVEDLVGHTSILTITGSATAAGYQSLLSSVQFWSVAANPVTSAQRAATFTITDVGSTKASGMETVTVSPPASLSGLSGLVTYVPTASPLTIAPSIVVTDAQNISSATVTFTNWQAGDRLTFSNTLALQHTFVEDLTAQTATLTITGIASAAGYQTLLRSVQFWSVAGNPITSIKRIATLSVTDVASNSASATESVAVA